MLKFSFLRHSATPLDQLKVDNSLHSKIDRRRPTITEALTINGILHYRVEVEHGTTRSFKLMSGLAMQQYRYRLVKKPDRPKHTVPEKKPMAADGTHTSPAMSDLPS
jgi:hypothetical protein